MSKCKRCNTEVIEALWDSCCPKCIFGSLLGHGSVSDDSPDSPTLAGFSEVTFIGEGGFGEVYYAVENGVSTRPVAIKVMHARHDSKGARRRFVEEIQAISLLDHRGVARAYESGETAEGRLYYTMEFIEGYHFAEWLQILKPSLEKRIRLIIYLCDTLAHCHEMGVIHRDLKPSNIIVTQQGGESLPKVIDFGLSRVVSGPASWGREATVGMKILGTPEYMSPEQWAASSQIDGRADVYNLGLLLYEILGEEPLLGGVVSFEIGWSENIERLREQSSQRVSLFVKSDLIRKSLLRSRLGKLDKIASKALAVNVDKRFQSARELGDALEEVLKKQSSNEQLRNLFVSPRFVVSVVMALLAVGSIFNYFNRPQKADSLSGNLEVGARVEEKLIMSSPELFETEEAIRSIAFGSDGESLWLRGNNHKLYNWKRGETKGSVSMLSEPSLPILDEEQLYKYFPVGVTQSHVSLALKAKLGLVEFPEHLNATAGTTSAIGGTIVYGVNEGNVYLSQNLGSAKKVADISGPVQAMEISPDGRWLLAGTKLGELVLISLDGEREVTRLQIPGGIKTLSINSRGDRLAIGGDYVVQLYTFPQMEDITHTIPENSFSGGSAGVIAKFSVGENLLVATQKNGQITRYWFSEKGKFQKKSIRHTAPVSNFLLSPDGQIMFTHEKPTSPNTGSLVRGWSLDKGEEVVPPMPHPQGVSGMALSHKLNILAVSSFDGVTRRWKFKFSPQR